MAEIKTVGIKEFKNKLSAYLRVVRTGTRLFVSDRDTIIAEVHEPYLDRHTVASLAPPLSDWVKSRTVRLPSGEKRHLEESPLNKPAGTALGLLDQDRGEA